MTDDILQHDDGVVDHKADRKGEGHEGEVIQAVTEQIHDCKGADDRHRQSQAGDHGGGEIAQEEEDHEHDQADGQNQGKLHVVNRRPNRLGAVKRNLQVYRGRYLRAQRGQDFFY